MSLSEISIKRPVFAWMLMFALLVFGWIGFKRMGVSLQPDVDYPVVNISASLEGASPELMEMDVIDPIEDAVVSIQGVNSVTSSARSGNANITIEFDLNKNIDVAVQEAQNAIARSQGKLPKDMEPPTVTKSNPEDQPIMWLAVSSDRMSVRDLMLLVRNQVKDQFSTIPGVGEVFVGGYQSPSLRVWVSADRLKSYELSVSDLISSIQSEHIELPAGRIETAKTESNVRAMGEAKSTQEFAKIPILKRGGSPNIAPIFLGQVAEIEPGLEDVRRITRSNGKPAVGLGLRKQRGSNAVEVAKAVRGKLANIQKQLPQDVSIGVRFDMTQFIEEAVHELNFTLILSAILTALVCWLFLGSWSATLNVIMAIPVSVVGSFIVLYALGFTLNTFTLLGLSLAIGIVVDDAIMVLENISRYQEKGLGRREAALVGSREITFAALAATASIIAIFLPIAFMKGMIGKFLYQFGVTLAVAVAISLLEALTLTPMRCAQFLTVGNRTTRIGRSIDALFVLSAKLYRLMIEKSLNYRWLTLGVCLAIFLGSWPIVKRMKKEYSPAQDSGRLMLRVQAPVGSSLEFTDSKFKEAEAYFSGRSEVDQYFGSVGGMGGGAVNAASSYISLKSKKDRPINPTTGKNYTQQELADVYRADLKKIKGAKVSVQDPFSGGGSKKGYPVEFTLQGPDWDRLVEYSQKIMDELKKSPLITDLDSDYQGGMPEIQVMPDREQARLRGVSFNEIAQTLRSMYAGVRAGSYNEGGRRDDILVKLRPQDRNQARDIEKLSVRNNRGELIPLKALVKIHSVKSPLAINRIDRQRAITIFGNLAANVSQEKAIEETRSVSAKMLPDGYHWTSTGSSKSMKETFDGLIFALGLGMLVAYMILASQFNSWIHPLIVLLALPFSVSGALFGLWVTHQSINLYSMIGIVLLMGIVKKNSILLVEFTNHMREQGLGVREALLEACPIRLRPILMTSIATVVGAIPAAISLGPGGETRVPMAIAVIGGDCFNASDFVRCACGL